MSEKSGLFTSAPCHANPTTPRQNRSSIGKPVRIWVVWSGRLNIQRVSISIIPFGLPDHKCGGNRYGGGGLECEFHRGRRIGVTGSFMNLRSVERS
ncbi:hypothetical protein AVEN_76853-1 [Araneus ventricosus]|uniref:Uncharacterized protein n=1 Tax=Araneus ventricosus TaxID=182803 RepID=A0A4Y2QA68_ARAVE|nr:hypothetical protein AVEN_76853-1 [Araneus ventricosus]